MPLVKLTHAEMVVDGLDHSEEVTFGPDGMACAGDEEGQVYRIDVQQRAAQEIASICNSMNTGLALDKAGNS